MSFNRLTKKTHSILGASESDPDKFKHTGNGKLLSNGQKKWKLILHFFAIWLFLFSKPHLLSCESRVLFHVRPTLKFPRIEEVDPKEEH